MNPNCDNQGHFTNPNGLSSTLTASQSDFSSTPPQQTLHEQGSTKFAARLLGEKWRRALTRTQNNSASLNLPAGVRTESIKPGSGAEAAAGFSIPSAASNKKAAPRASLQPIQEWEGYVTSIDSGSFSARLVDISAFQVLEQEEAVFPLSDVAPDDLPYLQIGAVFRWTIGYTRSASGGRMRASKVLFRRRGGHSPYDLDQAKIRSKELIEEIAWE